MNEDSRTRISITVVISLATHGAIALAVMLMPVPRIAPTLQDIELTLEIHAAMDEFAPAPPEPEPTPEEPTPSEAPTRTRELPTPGARTSTWVVRDDAIAAITPETPTEPAEPSTPAALPVETDAQRLARLRMLLDPMAVARGGVVFDAPTGATAGSAAPPRRRSAAEIGAELSASLRRDAMERPNRGRPPPVLRRQPDGSQLYAGHAFSATISPDGEVHFADRPNASIGSAGLGLQGGFDITDAVTRANGGDPYSAERAWFMRQTEALREQLEDAARVRSLAVSLRRLRGRLMRVWQDDARTVEQRRRAIFDEWVVVDESGADGGARALIVQFVRDNLPATDASAYPADELRRLNARRNGTARFAPYK